MFGSSTGHSTDDTMIPAEGLTTMNNEIRIPEGGFALLSTAPQNAALTAHVVTAVAFDPYEELLWTGNNAGRVISFFGAQLEKYTAFLSAANSDIRALLTSETVTFSLTPRRLKANRRQGISLFTHTSDHMTDLTCMHRLAGVPHELILGGNQQQIIQFDVETRKEIRIASVKQKNCLALRSNQKFLFSSDSEGNVTLRHLTTVDAIHALQAHQGSVADFDVCGNKLITCGCSPRLGKMTGDRFLMVYDLRTLRSLPPVPLPMAPMYCHFLPSYSDNRIMVCSQAGELIVMDLNDQSSQIPIQLDTNGFAITSLDVSSSRQCIAFGDQTGLIHLFSDRMEPIFNENSWATEFPDPVVIHPPVNIDDTEPPYAVFPLPFPTDDHYASEWPEQLCMRRFRQPDPIPEKVLESMRMVQFVGYAHNPRADTPLRGFNVCPYTNSTYERGFSNALKGDESFHIPKFYLLAEGTPVASKAEEIDFKRYNRTEFNAVENTADTTPACSLLLALYHLMNIRAVFLSHFCYIGGCISCEMNLLFRLLTDRPAPSVVSARNFMKTFRSVTEGKKWSETDASVNLSQAIRSFMQVLCKLLDKELSETAAGVALRKELEISFTLNNHCIRCSEHYQSALSQLCVSLVYPTNTEKIGFCTILEKTLNWPEQNETLCQKCGKLARIASTRRVRILPSILALDMTASSETEQTFWSTQIQAFENRPAITPNTVAATATVTERIPKICRYGSECKNPNCRYAHASDSKSDISTATATTTTTTTTTSTEGSNVDSEWSHYLPSVVHIKLTDGICTVSENKVEKAARYHLASATFVINESGTKKVDEHLVTAVKSKQDSSWLLFNNISVTEISEHEALHLDASWKLPAILYYVHDKDGDDKEASAEEEKRAVIPQSVFWNDFDSNAIRIPGPGSKVAVYAKYTGDKAGEKALYEICAVDNDGNCFVNSIVKEPETASTTTATDNANSSQSLKRVALKLLYLVQEKMTVIGYKIGKLFDILNIHVPEEQVKDIVLLYRSPFKRSLSLNALAQHFFGESVEEDEADIVDLARLSLRLYAKFIELKEADEADETDINIATLTTTEVKKNETL